MSLLGWFRCVVLRDHEWTSPAMEFGRDIPKRFHPDPTDGPEQMMAKFRSYLRMHCKRCGKISPLTP